MYWFTEQQRGSNGLVVFFLKARIGVLVRRLEHQGACIIKWLSTFLLGVEGWRSWILLKITL